MELYDNVVKFAKRRGMSITELAERAGMTSTALYKWQYQTPSLEKVKKVADILNVPIDELIGRNVTEKDIVDLQELLSSDEHMRFGGKELTEEQKERVLIVLEQLFWETRKKDEE